MPTSPYRKLTLCVVGALTLVTATGIGARPASPWDEPTPEGSSRAADQRSLGRVLITNDDGIDSPGLHALAAAFAEVADVVVVAPSEQASGSGMTSNVRREQKLTVRRADMPDGITAYAVDGYPVDCVIWGIDILFGSDGPDLVVSGINTNPNLGAAVYTSGTIGAAGMARRRGYPALAVSGGRASIEGHLEAGARYAVALARSELFASLGADLYLTLDIPLIEPEKFRGARVALHQLDSYWMGFAEAPPPDETGATYDARWRRNGGFHPESDFALISEGYLVVTPMTVAEQVPGLAVEWNGDESLLPPLSVAVPKR